MSNVDDAGITMPADIKPAKEGKEPVRYTPADNIRLIQLVKDAKRADLPIQAALVYVRSKLGKHVSEAKYGRILKFVRSQEAADVWMSEQARFGFVTDFRERKDTAERLLENTQRDLLLEETKNKEERDIDTIMELRKLVMQLNDNVHTYQLGSFVIARIKADVDAAKKVLSGSASPHAINMVKKSGEDTYVIPTNNTSQGSQQGDIRQESEFTETEF